MAHQAIKTDALATLFNPLVKNEKDLLTFCTTFCAHNAGDLVLVQRPNPSSERGDLPVPKHHQTGLIQSSSSIVALQLNNLTNVYGFIADKNGPTLMRLSPTIKPMELNITIKNPASLAGVTGPDESTSPDEPANPDLSKGWLYFVSNKKVHEYKIGTNSVSAEFGAPSADSFIAATLFGGKRHFFYQKEDPKVIMVQNAESGRDEDITGSDDAKPLTPLAACSGKNPGGDEIIYVYFIDYRNRLCRGSGKNASDIKIERIQKERNNITVFSRLAVTPGAKYNFVSYISQKDDKPQLAIFADERK